MINKKNIYENIETTHDWNDYENFFKDIFSRKYYTNHGKLAIEFEHKLEDALSINNAVTITNESIAYLIAIKCLCSGSVIVPLNSSELLIQSILWSGVKPIFINLDRDSNIENNLVNILDTNKDISLCILNNQFNKNDLLNIDKFLKKREINFLLDLTEIYEIDKFCVTSFSENTTSVFTLKRGSLIDSIEGSFIATNNDESAEKFRNMRSSYGTRKVVKVPLTANGRFSEAQAALGLMSFSTLENRRKNYLHKYKALVRLNEIDGIKILDEQATLEINSKGALTLENLLELFKKERILYTYDIDLKNNSYLSELIGTSNFNSRYSFFKNKLKINILNTKLNDIKNIYYILQKKSNDKQ